MRMIVVKTRMLNFKTDPNFCEEDKESNNTQGHSANEPHLLTMRHRNSHHKLGHHGEECLQRIAKLKGFMLT